MKVSGNIFRGIVYGVLVVLFLGAVVYKQGVIRQKRSARIISAISEWQDNGKPVIVKTASLHDGEEETKISLRMISEHDAEGDVPRAVWKALKIDQSIRCRDAAIQGKISVVSEVPDPETGMYRVRAVFDRAPAGDGKMFVASVVTGILSSRLVLPRQVLEREALGGFVWIVQDEKAYRRPVEIEKENGFGIIVKKGVEPGEMVIVEGQTLLRDGDKVLVREVQL